MLEPTRKHLTKTVELRVTVYQDDLEEARRAVAPYVAEKEDEETIHWREAFPEYGPHTAILGARTREGLTQRQLAGKLGIAQSNLSAMERGKRPIGKEMAKRLAQALNVDWKVFL